ncbi:MAG TPA: hypothetical protein VK558_07915 [Patescibacteria group bacterium]|nr:hypothetical protein [Patescibacteria group bacterium]
MKLTTSVAAGARSFAHFAGLTRAAGKAKSEDERDEREDAEDDDGKNQDQDREDGDSKKSKKAKADDDGDGDGASEDDDGKDASEDDEDDDKKSKKAKRASEDDEDDEDDEEDEMRGKSASASARRRERARWATVLGSRVSAGNPALAMNLLANTTMTRQQIIGVLRDTPAASSDAPAGRRNPNLGSGGEQSANSTTAISSSWDRAMHRVLGK